MTENPLLIGDASKARFISAIIDNLIAIFVTIMVVRMFPEHLTTLRGIALVAVYLGYYFVPEAIWRRTPGKYFQGLIVKKLDGSAADWKTAVVRTLRRGQPDTIRRDSRGIDSALVGT